MADISVQAIAGIGLTQNANAAQPWQLGKATMAEYYNQTLPVPGPYVLSLPQKLSPQPNVGIVGPYNPLPRLFPAPLVVVSLGGNDYNHQEGNVPTNATFTEGTRNFLNSLFE